jgi:hypothetical protein
MPFEYPKLFFFALSDNFYPSAVLHEVYPHVWDPIFITVSRLFSAAKKYYADGAKKSGHMAH